MTEQTITLPITGMSCANCAANIERGLKKLEGVQSTNVNFAAEQAVIAFDPKQLHVKDVVKNIEGSGYKVASAKIELPVTGMTCANCAANIERTLNKKVPGVVQGVVLDIDEQNRVSLPSHVARLLHAMPPRRASPRTFSAQYSRS